MKFSRLYKLLNEGIYNWSYTIPSSKKQLMMDFYILSTIRPDTDIDRFLLDKAKTKLFTHLKTTLLDEVFYAISDELKYIFNSDNSYMYGFIISKQEEPNSKYYKVGGYSISQAADILLSNNIISYEYEDLFNYVSVYNNIKSEKLDIPKFINYSKYLFNIVITQDEDSFLYKNEYYKAYWDYQYGKGNWINICDAWLKLYNAKSLNEMSIWIDHIYDIQHNTGTIFNKLDEYKDEDGSHSWIKRYLDEKKHARSLWSLLHLSSLSSDTFITKLIKNNENRSYEDYKLRYILYNHPEKFLDIKNPSEKLKEYLIDCLSSNIQYIKNPSINLMKKSVKINSSNLRLIKNPPVEIQKIAIDSFPNIALYLTKLSPEIKQYLKDKYEKEKLSLDPELLKRIYK